ncbi:hypothetical protein N9B82_05785 [Saprospiraceae bacterium]|nr:hypothetical protein [Saprospiraceae bacterium]
MSSGYSATPLARKLGMKSRFLALVYNSPQEYKSYFTDLPEDVLFVSEPARESLDIIHLFCLSIEEFEEQSLLHKAYLKKSGMIWISWPKGKSKIHTDLKRDPIREFLLQNGLVDVKVASIDEDWSGLKFVYRLKDR